jgi:hypothetical protein
MDIRHLILAVVGLLLIGVFFQSIIRVALLNKRPDDPVLNLAATLTAVLFIRRPSHMSDRKRQDQRGLWYWPVSQLILIATWFVLVVIGFACLYWAAQSVPSIEQAFIASGSALSTLGFATPPDTPGQVLAVVQGMIGLGIVVFVFTFIPGYLSAIQQRDDQVAWVYARSDGDPTGSALLEWLVAADRSERLDETWEAWEAWFRSMGEAQTLSPLISFDRSVRRNESWVAASGAMLDAAAFATSSLDMPGRSAADVCLATGEHALLSIERALAPALRHVPVDVAIPAFDGAGYDALRARLSAAGVPLHGDRDADLAAFMARRDRYVRMVTRLTMAVTPGHELVRWSLTTPKGDVVDGAPTGAATASEDGRT